MFAADVKFEATPVVGHPVLPSLIFLLIIIEHFLRMCTEIVNWLHWHDATNCNVERVLQSLRNEFHSDYTVRLAIFGVVKSCKVLEW